MKDCDGPKFSLKATCEGVEFDPIDELSHSWMCYLL